VHVLWQPTEDSPLEDVVVRPKSCTFFHHDPSFKPATVTDDRISLNDNKRTNKNPLAKHSRSTDHCRRVDLRLIRECFLLNIRSMQAKKGFHEIILPVLSCTSWFLTRSDPAS
jgi:hypothetical protein